MVKHSVISILIAFSFCQLSMGLPAVSLLIHKNEAESKFLTHDIIDSVQRHNDVVLVKRGLSDSDTLESRVGELEEKLEFLGDLNGANRIGATGSTGPRGRDVGSQSNIVKYMKMRVSDLEEALVEEEAVREQEVGELQSQVDALKNALEGFDPADDPCSVKNGGCSHICLSGDGVVTCVCEPGYELGPDNFKCTDINECDSDDQPCYFECQNNDGSFVCVCPPGYTLDQDQVTCSDVDECADQNGGCEQLCINSEGGYECGCEERLELAQDGHACIFPPQ